MINLLETLPNIPAVSPEWMALSPLLVLLGVGCLGIVLEAVLPREVRYLVQSAVALLGVIAALALTIGQEKNGYRPYWGAGRPYGAFDYGYGQGR